MDSNHAEYEHTEGTNHDVEFPVAVVFVVAIAHNHVTQPKMSHSRDMIWASFERF